MLQRNRAVENNFMHFDLAKMRAQDGYKLLISTVVPRPIALVSTVDRQGHVNAAPFSFFNAVSSDPPVVVLGINGSGPGGNSYKDTEANIRETGEFVVNLVDEALAERMNICAVDFPTEMTELEPAKLNPAPSVGVAPPRIAESPVCFECKRITGLSLGNNSMLEVGRVIHIHIRDDLMDMEKLYVKTDQIGLIGRMHGRGWYTKTHDLFLMDRMDLADWQARRG
jgi:flavin reductase (DIM6/NTAB) family NADH-FMN oxidoreductase RutF